MKAKECEISLQKAELKVQRDHVDDIQLKMKYIKDELDQTEYEFLSEKQFRLKIGK